MLDALLILTSLPPKYTPSMPRTLSDPVGLWSFIEVCCGARTCIMTLYVYITGDVGHLT